MECPCWIEFDFSSFRARELQKVRASVWEAKEPLHAEFNEQAGGDNIMAVSRGQHDVTVLAGLHLSGYEDGIVTIPLGAQSDSLCVCTKRLDCSGEVSGFAPEANRQFASVTLKVMDEHFEEDLREMKVVGDINGFDCRNMVPRRGKMEFSLPRSESHEYKFRLPRQTLVSQVYLTMERISETIHLPLGDWISRAGYDWFEEDLREVEIVVNETETTVKVTISGWGDGNEYIMDF